MKYKKILKGAMWVFVIPALLLTNEDAQNSRNMFIALSWAMFVLVGTEYWLREWSVIKNTARLLAIPLLYHFALLVSISVGDAISAWLNSDGMNNAVYVVQRSIEEAIKLPAAISNIIETGDARQFNGRFTWAFLLLGAMTTLSLLLLVVSIAKATPKKIKAMAKRQPEMEQ